MALDLGSLTLDYEFQLVPKFAGGSPISVGTLSISLDELRATDGDPEGMAAVVRKALEAFVERKD